MFTLQASKFMLHRIFMIVATVLLVSSGLTLPVAAKEKYVIDPATGTKYKPESEMKDLLLVLGELGGEQLERNFSSELSVLGEVDFSHPACAEFFRDVIVGKGLADHVVRL